MMEELLCLLKTGRPLQVEELALKLEVSKNFLFTLLEDLIRRGYLQSGFSPVDCRGSCCSCSKNNSLFRRSRLWGLTEKGKAFLKRKT